MKKPFAVGERVAVYDQDRVTGVITKVISDTMCMVRVAKEDFDCEYHVKQLRRLKPKREPREWTVSKPDDVTPTFWIHHGAVPSAGEVITVREARKR